VDGSLAAGWAVAIATFVIAAAMARRAGGAWARRALALLVLYLIALTLAGWLAPPAWRAWASAIAAGAVLLAAQPFIALGVLPPTELGLAPPRAGTMRVAVVAIALAVLLNVAVMVLRGAKPVHIEATGVAALVAAAALEELVFRGVLLALLDRALPPGWTVAGARIGPGGVALTVAFIALHGLRPGIVLVIVPAALLYLWLRARTGSLLAPIAAHLAWNLSVLLVH
jgi:membrane protease YdiL (CAAX protease family)